MVLCMRFFIGGSACLPRTAILGINVVKGTNRGEVNDSLSTTGGALEVVCFSCISRALERIVFQCAVEGVSSSFIKRQMILYKLTVDLTYGIVSLGCGIDLPNFLLEIELSFSILI